MIWFYGLLTYILCGNITVFVMDFYFTQEGSPPESGRIVLYIMWLWPLLLVAWLIGSIQEIIRGFKS